MKQLAIHRTISEVRPFAEAWTRLAARETAYAPFFEDLIAELSPEGTDFRFMVVTDGEEVRALACFLLWRGKRTYWLSQLKLFTLGVPTAGLFAGGTLGASAMLGNPDRETAAMMLDAILAEPMAGILDLGDIPAGRGLHQAACARGWRAIVQENDRAATRRLVPLSDGFEAYFESLRSSTRKAVRRDRQLFERLAPQMKVTSAPEDVATFLRDANQVWTRTYQTRMGMMLHDDEATRARLTALAQAGRLRAYLAYVDGKPGAFAWGDISHGIFYFRMTGYDPDLGRHCPGTALLFHVLNDLADGRHCTHFDFGVRDMDYKERFGTISIPYTVVSISRWTRPVVLVATLADLTLNGAKALLDRFLGPKQIARIRRLLRR